MSDDDRVDAAPEPDDATQPDDPTQPAADDSVEREPQTDAEAGTDAEDAEDDTPRPGIGVWPPGATRAVAIWGGLMVVVFTAFGLALGAIADQQYSASGFVRGYLQALADHNLDAALSRPGVRPAQLASAAALQPDALGTISDIRAVDEEEGDDGTVTVTMSYLLSTDGVEPHRYRSEFQVERSGTALWLFPTWRFASSPIERVNVSVEHGTAFTVNDLPVDAAGVEPGERLAYYLPSPGIYTIDAATIYLAAQPRQVVLTGGESPTVDLAMEPTQTFIDTVQSQVDAFLDGCTEQDVLFPTGCPFGQYLSDRLTGPPQWSIADYPEVRIESTVDGWSVPTIAGVAHLGGEVRDLADGELETVDRDIEFEAGWDIAIDDAGQVTVSIR